MCLAPAWAQFCGREMGATQGVGRTEGAARCGFLVTLCMPRRETRLSITPYTAARPPYISRHRRDDLRDGALAHRLFWRRRRSPPTTARARRRTPSCGRPTRSACGRYESGAWPYTSCVPVAAPCSCRKATTCACSEPRAPSRPAMRHARWSGVRPSESCAARAARRSARAAPPPPGGVLRAREVEPSPFRSRSVREVEARVDEVVQRLGRRVEVGRRVEEAGAHCGVTEAAATAAREEQRARWNVRWGDADQTRASVAGRDEQFNASRAAHASLEKPRTPRAPPPSLQGQRTARPLTARNSRPTTPRSQPELAAVAHALRRAELAPLGDDERSSSPDNPQLLLERLDVFRRAFAHFIAAFGLYAPLLLAIQTAYEDVVRQLGGAGDAWPSCGGGCRRRSRRRRSSSSGHGRAVASLQEAVRQRDMGAQELERTGKQDLEPTRGASSTRRRSRSKTPTRASSISSARSTTGKRRRRKR